MQNGKILVTGGTGYIGSHTVCRLMEQGYMVISADNLSNSFEDVNDRIEQITGTKPLFVKVELCDQQAVDNLFKEHPDIQGIIHFAAYKAVGESVSQPLKYYHNNLTALINVLNAAQRYNVKSFVFSSSCTVYGQPDKLPVNESSPVQQQWSPYGNTKRISEEIIKDFSSCYKDLKTISLRYFNPIGAHPSGKIGELPTGIPNNLLPYITQTAFGIREHLNIYGGNYNTPDGTAIRDYIHVLDLADAHLAALERIENKKNESDYEVFNLGTGKGYSVLEIVNAFHKVTGVDVPHQIIDRRPGDIEQIWADPSKANTVLGWKTARSLEEMLADSWKWENYYRNTVLKKEL